MAADLRRFREVVLIDFEFFAPAGERPEPVCMVAWELFSGRRFRIFREELRGLRQPPFAMGGDSLYVAYYASAEIGCHLALNWPVPNNVLDLFVEFRNATNGRTLPCGAGLLGALTYHGLDAMAAAEKESMRQLAMRGGVYTEGEKRDLLDYCQGDVMALQQLLERMEPSIDLERALLRGRYMKAAARIEFAGVPVDVEKLAVLRENWPAIQDRLIERIDANYGVYDGRTFKLEKFARWLNAHDIPWPRLKSGQLELSDDAFKDMARGYPILTPLRELRGELSRMRLAALAVGHDGRNRVLLSAFRATTGRNQPSNSKFIFGPSAWLHGLIRPEAGRALAYVDYCQQEFGIAAALSGDTAMMAAYESGDPYLQFAKDAGAAPPDATKKTHAGVRDQFKQCALGVQYSMGAEALATRIGQPTARGRDLLELHHRAYPKFWRWSDAVADHAMLHGNLYTVFGWYVFTGPDTNARSLRNFPMQANGAEMLRLACSFATERGIAVVAPVHDALLIEAPAASLNEAVAVTLAAMEEASAVVLDGFRLRSDAKLVIYPDRYEDERGREMWKAVWDCIAELRLKQEVDA